MPHITYITFLAALATGQTINIQALSAFPAAPTPSFAVGVRSQAVSYDPAAAAAKVYAAVVGAVKLNVRTLAQNISARDIGELKIPADIIETLPQIKSHTRLHNGKHPTSHPEFLAERGTTDEDVVKTRLRVLTSGRYGIRERMFLDRMSGTERPDIEKLHARGSAFSPTPVPNACLPEATGAGPVSVPDAPEAFAANPKYGRVAVAASTPNEYIQTFVNLTASNIAYGYLGFQYVNAYEPKQCAKLCNNMDGCSSFNIYFERDPIITPGPYCINPNSTTAIKCAFWGGDIEAYNAINNGQYREQFHVLIAGSNGYTSNGGCSNPTYPGYSQPAPLGNATILAIPDCQGVNTYLGFDYFTDGPFDFNLCAAACEGMSTGNLALNVSGQTCQFYTTYLLYKNGVALGQYCALYSEYWADSFATNVGQYDDVGNHYTISNSYSSYNLTNPGYANPKCSWQTVPTANIACGPSSIPTSNTAVSLSTSSTTNIMSSVSSIISSISSKESSVISTTDTCTETPTTTTSTDTCTNDLTSGTSSQIVPPHGAPIFSWLSFVLGSTNATTTIAPFSTTKGDQTPNPTFPIASPTIPTSSSTSNNSISTPPPSTSSPYKPTTTNIPTASLSPPTSTSSSKPTTATMTTTSSPHTTVPTTLTAPTTTLTASTSTSTNTTKAASTTLSGSNKASSVASVYARATGVVRKWAGVYASRINAGRI